MKKGQITIFMMVGILVIAVFAALWYMNQNVLREQFRGPTDKIIADLLKTGAVPYYVGVCLEEKSKDGLWHIANSGGNIYMKDGGPLPMPAKTIPFSNVSYGISRPPLQDNTIFPPPPGYPGGAGPLLQVPQLRFGYPGMFGQVTLTKLCAVGGANSPFLFGEEGGAYFTNVFCFNNMYGEYQTTQWQLEQYVAKQIINCTNWTAIQQETGYNVTRAGDVNVTVRYGLSDVWVDAYIPLEIKVANQDPVYTVGDFHKRIPVRLKRLVELAATLSDYDAYYLDWNITYNYTGLIGAWDTGISINVTAPMTVIGVWDEIITLTDRLSLLEGKYYYFKFGRENRHPALDMIHYRSNWSYYDIVVMEGETIIIDPNPEHDIFGNYMGRIYDPDEDNLTYYYTGWKATCDELYDLEFNLKRTMCSEQEPTRPEYFYEVWNRGATFKTAFFDWRAVYESVDELYAPPYDDEAYPPVFDGWLNSDAYRQTERNATYTPTREDIGPHNVTIWVCDEGGLCDYQVVQILVIDYPMLRLNGTNPYFELDKSIPYNYASVEDWYELSSAGTTGYISQDLGLIQGFLFRDDMEPFRELRSGSEPIMPIPLPEPPHARDIRYVWNYTFDRKELCTAQDAMNTTLIEDYEQLERCDAAHEIHNISLTIPTLDIIPKRMNVSVYQCLPFRNKDEPWPWPYVSNDDESYLGSHLCCSVGNAFNMTFTSGEMTPSSFGHSAYSFDNEWGRDTTVRVFNSSGDVVCEKSYNPIIYGDTVYFIPPGTLDVAAYIFGAYYYPNTLCSSTYPMLVAITGDSVEISLPNTMIPVYEDWLFYVEQSTAEEPDYAWGAVLPSYSVCYHEDPVIGVFTEVKKRAELYGPPDVGATSVVYEGATSSAIALTLAKKWWNDNVVGEFKRNCDGTRGNTCTGLGEVTIKGVGPDCENMDEDAGEIESCNGPTSFTPTWNTSVMEQVFSFTDPSDCTYYSIATGTCWEYPGIGCTGTKYTGSASRPMSFESYYGLPRRDDIRTMANGTCNPTPTCSDDETDYDVDVTRGRWLIPGATCSGGSCSAPLAAIDCEDKNGLKDDGFEYCTFDGSSGSLQTRRWWCNKGSTYTGSLGSPDEKAHCEPVGPMGDRYVDPDERGSKTVRQHCDACAEATDAGMVSHSGAWVSHGGQSNCCGDDKGEGGYPYGVAGVTVHNGDGRFVSGREGSAGLCNDYTGSDPLDTDNWIDNNCYQGANCLDSTCYGEEGPTGVRCCGGRGDCEDGYGLDTDIGLSCTGHMCGCSYVGDMGAVLAPTTIATCLPPYSVIFPEGGYDRYYTVTASSAVSFSLNVYDMDGDTGADSVCSGRISFYINDVLYSGGTRSGTFNIKFASTAGENCIVELEMI